MGVAANAVGRSSAYRPSRIACLPGAIPIVARPGGRRKGEDLVVTKESDIIGNIAS